MITTCGSKIPQHVNDALNQFNVIAQRVGSWKNHKNRSLFVDKARETLRELSASKRKHSSIQRNPPQRNAENPLNILEKSGLLTREELEKLKIEMSLLTVNSGTHPDHFNGNSLDLLVDLYGDKLGGYNKELALRKALVKQNLLPKTYEDSIPTDSTRNISKRERDSVLSIIFENN